MEGFAKFIRQQQKRTKKATVTSPSPQTVGEDVYEDMPELEEVSPDED
jgi:hypothetical protein